MVAGRLWPLVVSVGLIACSDSDAAEQTTATGGEGGAGAAIPTESAVCDGEHCCGAGKPCPGDQYCYVGACHDPPTITLDTPGPDGCSDLGVYGPPDVHWRLTIVGRPGAPVSTYTDKPNCPGQEPGFGIHVLDPQGELILEGVYPEPPACDVVALGTWHSWAKVDDLPTQTVTAHFHHSGCPGVATCTDAQSHCGTP